MIYAITLLGWVAIVGSSLLLLVIFVAGLAGAAGKSDENLDRMVDERRAKEAEHDLDMPPPPPRHK